MKKHFVLISMGIACILLYPSRNLFGKDEQVGDARASHPWGRKSESASPTFSLAKDVTFLLDQIAVSLRFEDNNFKVATRPGQNIYVSKLTAPGKVKQYALVWMPGEQGKEISREEVRASGSTPRMHVIPLCLNSMSAPLPRDLEAITAADCLDRAVGDQEKDRVIRLESSIQDMAIGDVAKDPIGNATMSVLGYAPSGFHDLSEFNPFEKCCLQKDGIEVCGCSVQVAGEGRERGVACNAGCTPVPE